MKAAVRHARDGIFGLAVSALCLVAIEGALRWRSADPVASPVSLSRGFDEKAAYLVPDPEVPGGYVTQFSDGRFPEKHFAAASDRRRIVLVGGSNTAAFGTKYLQGALDERAGAGIWEVCNLGRAGYGSERVRIVTEQALRLLDPDLIVVYSGHNEFVERGFRIDLDRAWQGELETRIGDWAQRSRLVGKVADWLRPEDWRTAEESSVESSAKDSAGAGADSSASPAEPEAHRDEYKKFQGLEWETTLEYFEAYRRNLISIGRSCVEGDVDVLFCSVVYNRFAAPFESTLNPSLPAKVRAQHAELRSQIESVLPDHLRRLSPENGWEHLFHYDWVRDRGHLAPDDLPGLRRLSGVLAEKDSILPEPKSKTMRHYRSLNFLFQPLLRTAAEEVALARARKLLIAALALVPDHPRSLFEYGLVLTAMDLEPEQAARAFELAGALDRAPRRGSALSNRLAADAAQRLGAPFFDADALFSMNSPGGLVGYEFMIDECHLSLGGVLVLLDDLATELCSE